MSKTGMPPPPPGAVAEQPQSDRQFAITSGRIEGPQRIVLYGPGGIGKSTLASLAPGAVLLDIEQGSRELDARRIGNIETFADLRACLQSDALDGVGGLRADFLGRFFGDDAGLGHDFGRGGLDFHPRVELRLFAPHPAHLGMDVAIGQHQENTRTPWLRSAGMARGSLSRRSGVGRCE